MARLPAAIGPPAAGRRPGAPLGPGDADALDELRAVVGEPDWIEGGFVHRADVLWGVYEGGHLAAAGNMTDFDGAPADVGLVTRPDARGTGLATAVAASMCAAAAPDIPLLRYRALTTNTASLRVARGWASSATAPRVFLDLLG